MGIINFLFKIPFVRSFFGHIILTGLCIIIMKFGLFYVQNNYLKWVSPSYIKEFVIIFGLGVLLFHFWHFGKWLLVTFFVGLALFVSATGFLNLFHFTKYNKEVFITSLFLASLVLPLRFLIKKFYRSKLNLTMDQVDALGNGNSQDKGKAFEEYICNLYLNLGYQAKTVDQMKADGTIPPQLKGLSGDGGADVIAINPQNGNKFVIQCKHYTNTVGRDAIYQASAALKTYSGTHALVVTNNFFTQEAKVTAEDNQVILIDRYQLAKLIANASNVS